METNGSIEQKHQDNQTNVQISKLAHEQMKTQTNGQAEKSYFFMNKNNTLIPVSNTSNYSDTFLLLDRFCLGIS